MTTFKGQLLLALILNVGLKLLTFTLSTILTRKLLPDQNGVYFTFNVYNDAVLFVAREATRNVASRLSIVEEDEEAVREPHPDKDGAVRAAQPTRRRVNVQHVHRIVSIALCSVPLAAIAVVVLEAIGLCFGSVSFFPSMLRHAKVSTQLQQAYTVVELSGSEGPMERFSLLLLPYLPELTVLSCAVLMAIVEPCVVLVQSLNLFRVVVLAECATLTARLSTIIGIVYLSQRRGASQWQADGEAWNSIGLHSLWEARMALAFGQLAYAITHIVYYSVAVSGLPIARWLGASAELQQVRAVSLDAAAHGAGDDVSRASTGSTSSVAQKEPSFFARHYNLFAFPWCFYSGYDCFLVCREYAALLQTFLRESLLRLVLSEGESFALTSLGSEAARGYYQLIYSLGSLVARLLFRVWENACFVKWSREASLGRQEAAIQLLKLMLRLSFYVGFSFTLLGPPLTQAFLSTMYTSRWATPQVTQALQLYFYGLPLMAWNGLLEAFLRAVASPPVLRRLQGWMVGETVVYIAACYVTLISFGKEDSQGDSVSVLVLLNVCNMLWRCGASIYLLVSSPAPTSAAVAAGASPRTSSLVTVDVFQHLFSPRILAALVGLFSATRIMTVSLAEIALVGVAYGALILAWDAEVRRLLVAPVWSRINPLLKRRMASAAPEVAVPTKKQQ